MSGTSSLLQLWQIPSTKLLFTRAKFSKGLYMVSGTEVYPALCFCKNMQTATYEVVNGSYVPTAAQSKHDKIMDKPLATQETVGAFQKLPMVMPSVDILYSALRKAKRVSPTKGIANAAKRERNKGAKQLDALMKANC